MCQHEKKSCPRCKSEFECKPGNITQCQCYGFAMSEELKAYLEQRYADCLCRKCLQYLSVELNLFKERYIFRRSDNAGDAALTRGIGDVAS